MIYLINILDVDTNRGGEIGFNKCIIFKTTDTKDLICLYY